MKIAGVSIWIWLAGMIVCAAIVAVAIPKFSTSKSGQLPLEIVKEDVWRDGKGYEVRGEICNPRKDPVRNVRISYELRGKYKGTGKMVGVVSAVIKYIPPGGTIDFTAVGPTTLMIEQFAIDDPKGKIEEISPMKTSRD